MNNDFFLSIDGLCPICERSATFQSSNRWLRGGLICLSCENGSVPRERALALVLNRERPNWRDLSIHESSPAQRGISLKLQRECKSYLGTHYHSDEPPGAMIGKFRNENIEHQTFADQSFDIVVTLDVFEHVFNPGVMLKEIHRTLRSDGIFISTFPIRKYLVESHKPRARREADGTVTHLEKPEYHGNPIDSAGSLVTFDYGYDIHSMLAYWAPFDVEICRFSSRMAGILGEYTEVIVCRKRSHVPTA